MIFWDTSALVPLLVNEPQSKRARDLAREDPEILVWWGSPIECLSAIARREREGGLDPKGADGARRVLEALDERWSQVTASEAVREHAGRLLRRHPLRSADALQLGAAITWARGRPTGQRIATLDSRLSEVARREGFTIVL